MISKWLLGLWLQHLQRVGTDLWPKVTDLNTHVCQGLAEEENDDWIGGLPTRVAVEPRYPRDASNTPAGPVRRMWMQDFSRRGCVPACLLVCASVLVLRKNQSILVARKIRPVKP